MSRVGYLRGTWEPGFRKILKLTRKFLKHMYFVKYIAKYTVIMREISNKPDTFPTLLPGAFQSHSLDCTISPRSVSLVSLLLPLQNCHLMLQFIKHIIKSADIEHSTA